MHFAEEKIFEGNFQKRNNLLEKIFEMEVCLANLVNRQVEHIVSINK